MAKVTPELIDRVAAAIAEADARVGYRCTLTRLVDGEATYTLIMGGGAKPLEFPGHDEAMDHVDACRARARAEAVIAAIGAAA
jgi:hypothetical protein